MPLNANEWQCELSQFAERHDELSGYFLVPETLTRNRLCFVIENFAGTLDADIWDDLSRSYGPIVNLTMRSSTTFSRQKRLLFEVCEPRADIMARLRAHTKRQMEILHASVWSPSWIAIAFLIALLNIGWASHELHLHWHRYEEPWTGLLHFALTQAAYCWPSSWSLDETRFAPPTQSKTTG